jgi:hypothetical protein
MLTTLITIIYIANWFAPPVCYIPADRALHSSGPCFARRDAGLRLALLKHLLSFIFHGT